MSGRATGQFAGALVLCAMALVCRAEANWYKVEVLVFRQSFHSREQTQLRYAPAYPANVIALHPNRTAPQARTTARIAQERKPARPHAATANKPKLEPALSAQVAAAERAEETQRLNIELNTPAALAPDWAFVQLKDPALDLSAAAQRLAHRPGYSVTRLVAWVQPLDEGAKGTPVMIAVEPTGPLGGFVTLRRRGKLELDIDLWYEKTDAGGAQDSRPDTGAAVAAPDPEVAIAQAARLSAPRVPSVTSTGAEPGAIAAGSSPGGTPTAAAANTRRVGLRETVNMTPGQMQYIDSPALGALVRVDLVSKPVVQRLQRSDGG